MHLSAGQLKRTGNRYHPIHAGKPLEEIKVLACLSNSSYEGLAALRHLTDEIALTAKYASDMVFLFLCYFSLQDEDHG
jgi:hypothetical protein